MCKIGSNYPNWTYTSLANPLISHLYDINSNILPLKLFSANLLPSKQLKKCKMFALSLFDKNRHLKKNSKRKKFYLKNVLK